MMTTIEAMKQALEALAKYIGGVSILNDGPDASDVEHANEMLVKSMQLARPAINALREAIAHEEAQMAEPVAWRVWIGNNDGQQYIYSEDGDGEPLYTRPAPAKTSERAALINESRVFADNLRVVMEDQAAGVIDSLCDMLAADADAYNQGRYDEQAAQGPYPYPEDEPMAADAQEVAVPPGWKLAPIEPTQKMLDATYAGQHCSEIWHDMLNAAPQPPQAGRKQMADDEILSLVTVRYPNWRQDIQPAFVLWVARAIEAHYKIGKQEPTDWSAAAIGEAMP